MADALPLCVTLHVTACAYLWGTKEIDRVFSTALILFMGFWYIVPGVLPVIFPIDELASFLNYPAGFSDDDFYTAYVFESLGLWAVLTGFVITLRMKGRLAQKKRSTLVHVNHSTAWLLTLLLAAVVVGKLLSSNDDYLSANSAAGYGERDSVLPLLGSFISSAGVAYVVFSEKWSLSNIVCFVLICLTTLGDVLAGARFSLALPLFVLFFRWLRGGGHPVQTIGLAIGGAVIAWTVLMPLAISVGQQRQSGTIAFVMPTDRVGADTKLAVAALFGKLNSFSTGAILIKEGRRTGIASAGFTPYIGSMLIFLPRSIWKERPVAGSADGTIYGHPSRIVGRILTDSDASNVGLPPLHVSLWQLGLWGAPLFIISGIGFLWYVHNLVGKKNLLCQGVGIWLLSLPHFNFLLPSPDVMVMRMVVSISILVGVHAVAKSVLPNALRLRHLLGRGLRCGST